MIYLASQSPRRHELLRQIGIDFTPLVIDVDEHQMTSESAVEYVKRVTLDKANCARNLVTDYPVLTADTAVVVDDAILGKPVNEADAIDMLMMLSGRQHEVLTAVALTGETQSYRLSRSQVRFRPVSVAEAQAYWQTGEPADKAGGYAIQGIGAIFVEHISGSYSGVMGLPLFETAELLHQFNIPLLHGV